MTLRPAIALMVVGGLVTSGCNLAPRYERPALPVSQTLPAREGQPATTAEDAVTINEVSWQDFIADEKLRQVIALGLANNRDLRVAAANIEQARALYRIERADLLPTAVVGADASFQRQPANRTVNGDRNTEAYSVNVGLAAFEIDLFGRIRNLSEAALEQYLATAEARNAVQISLVAEIAQAYLTMAADQEQLRISLETLGTFRQSLDLTRAQFEAGIASELGVRQAQTSYDQARFDIARNRALVAQDQNALNLLVGTMVPADLLPNGLPAESAVLTNLPADVRSEVLLRRPDVQRAEHLLIAQNANIGAARAAFFPSISLTAVAGTLSGSLSGLFGGGTGNWSVAPSATLPIFDFGRNRANLRYTEASRDAAVAEYELAIQTAFREVADALAVRATIDEQLAARRSLLEAATKAYQISDARFRAGVDPFLTTLDAQRTLYSAEQVLTQTRLAQMSNLVELYRALGGGLR